MATSYRTDNLTSSVLLQMKAGRMAAMILENKPRARIPGTVPGHPRCVVTTICADPIVQWLLLSLCFCSIGCSASWAFAFSHPAMDAVPLIDAPGDTLPDAPSAQVPVMEKGLPLAILKDQVGIWSSPARIRTHDLIWLLPLGAATGVTIATDTDVMRDVSHKPSFNKDCVNASDVLLGAQIAVPITLYGVGLFKEDAHARETGILSGEALADSVVLDLITKIVFRRERPLYNNASGDFFSSNAGNNSFPSSHSMLAWSMAGVIAGEYPSKWVQLSTYSLATSVSLMRVLGQEHFPTDVLVGGAAGWLIGHYVFKKHSLHPLTNKVRGKS